MKNEMYDARMRESAVKLSYSIGVAQTAKRFGCSKTILYRWRSRYDGTPGSLLARSHRPHRCPTEHTQMEIDMLKRSCAVDPHAGLVMRWQHLRKRGYTRSISGLYRALQRTGFYRIPLPNPKKVSQPMEQMQYPGQRVQIDIKHVPKCCILEPGKKYYQITAIDEFSRWRYLEAVEEASTYSTAQFVLHLIQKAPFKIECIQTDNGPEFTKWKQDPTKNKPTKFEETLINCNIRHKKIRPYTPRHNGKVERSHRKDNEWFYAKTTFYSFQDFQHQLSYWNKKYNTLWMRPLGYRSPGEYLRTFLFEHPEFKKSSKK